MVHDNGVYLRREKLPLEFVAVLLGYGDEVGPEKDALDSADAEELSGQRRYQRSLFIRKVSRLAILEYCSVRYKLETVRIRRLERLYVRVSN